MSLQGNNNQGNNIKYLSGGISYAISPVDDVINCDTTLGVITLYLPHIQDSVPKRYYINDYGGFSGTNNIIVLGVNNTINGSSSFIFDTNYMSGEAVVTGQTEWLINSDRPEQGTGTVTSFSFTNANGFTGTVSNPTTSPALTLSISDARITGSLLTSLPVGANTPITAADSILIAFANLQAQIAAVEAGDVDSVTGTSDRITVSPTTGDVVVDIAATYAGQASIVTVGALTSGSLATGFTPVSAPIGGTGQSVYAVGDILYASTTTILSKLADIATGNALLSGGIGVAPAYGKVGLTTHISGILPLANGGTNTDLSAGGAIGDILYGATSSTFARLADVAVGSVLTSGGVGAAPSYSASPTLTTSLTTPLLIGGIGITSTLTFKTTTGVGTTGADFVWLNGSNGATEQMRLLFSGTLSLGGTTGLASGGGVSVLKTAAATIEYMISNASANSAAFAQFKALNNNSVGITMGVASSGVAAGGGFGTSQGYISSSTSVGLALMANNSTGTIKLYTGGSADANEAARFLSSREFIIGGTVLYSALYTKQEINSSGAGGNTYGGIALNSWNSGALRGSYLVFNRSKSATIGTHTIVANGDSLGGINWGGSNGTLFVNGAGIQVEVDGAPATGNDMPARILFLTTPDGSGTLTEALRINSLQNSLFGAATATGRKIDILQDSATWSLGSLIGSTSIPAIYGNASTPSATNYALAASTSFTIINAPTASGVLQFNINGTTLVRGIAAGWFFGGTTVATAKIHIAAGATGAGTSPFKFTLSGADVLATPEAGVLETNATSGLFYTISDGTRKTIAYTDSTMTGIWGGTSHTGASLGFYGVTPVARPSAYTQTYATTTRTNANPTGVVLTDSTTGTPSTTLVDVGAVPTQANINNNFSSVLVQINNLVADMANIKQLVNSIIDDDQSQGLKQ